MKSQPISRRTLTTAAIMLAVAAGAVIGLSLFGGDSKPAQGSEPQVVLLSDGDLGVFAQFQSIASASRLDQLRELPAATAGGSAVVAVDERFAADLAAGDLRPFAASGSAIIGLGISLNRLNQLTGFEDELRTLNPKFADQLPSEEVPTVPFYSLVWRTPPGANPARWSRLQHYVSDGLFEVIVGHYKLRVRGLYSEGDRVLPLEEYGESAQ